jgi:hypothetical protein
MRVSKPSKKDGEIFSVVKCCDSKTGRKNSDDKNSSFVIIIIKVYLNHTNICIYERSFRRLHCRASELLDTQNIFSQHISSRTRRRQKMCPISISQFCINALTVGV